MIVGALRTAVRPLLLMCCGLLIAASCSVGKGNKLESLAIAPQGGALGDKSAKVLECTRSALQLLGSFTNGEIGDFTTRGKWTSSDPKIVEVSNGDIEAPGFPGQVFANGTLIPRSPGTATVTGQFLDLSAKIEIDVTALDSLELSPSSQRVAPDSTQQMTAFAVVNGVKRTITGFANWSFTNPDDNVATINQTTGLISAKAAGGPLTVQADFTSCGQTPSAQISVAPIQSLVLQPEFDSDPNEVVTGFSESFKTFADFGDGPEQDLTFQSFYQSTDTGILRFALTANEQNIGDAVAAGGPVTVTSEFTDNTVNPAQTFTSNEVQVSVVDAMLDSVSVTPQNPTLKPRDTLQFHATGSFDGGARTQDITRHVTWESSDRAQVTISNARSNAGLATSLSDDAGEVTITATNDKAQVTPSDSTKLTVQP